MQKFEKIPELIHSKAYIAMYEINKLIKKGIFPIERAYIKKANYKEKFPLKVIVTGMPRSGTSFLAGLIVRMGYSAGPVRWLKPADKHNIYGYYECLPVFHEVTKIKNKVNPDLYMNPQPFQSDWLKKSEKEIKRIMRIIEAGGIEIYKDTRLVVLADLFSYLYPEAKWIYIYRDIESTYKSSFGNKISYNNFINSYRQMEKFQYLPKSFAYKF